MRLGKKINWQHGWYPDYFLENSTDPFMSIQNHNWSKPGFFNLDARKSEEQNLLMLGVKNCRAIGLPIVYAHVKEYRRIKDSLLVMPGHSLDYISLTSNEHEYVDYINSIKKDFSKVTICVHPSCLRNGYWINTFKKSGFPVVTGVEIKDINAFQKLQKMFSQYEYCTTNVMGSHIIYGSLFHCKLSVIGTEPKLSIEDFTNTIHWRDEPNKFSMIDTLNKTKVSYFLRNYPMFDVEHPIKATNQHELALIETGFNNRIDSLELKEIIEFVKNHSSDKLSLES